MKKMNSGTKEKTVLIRIILITLGAIGILDTFLLSAVSTHHFGTIMPAVLGVPLLLMGIFYAQFQTFVLSSAFGAFIKWFLIILYSLFVLVVAVASIFIGTAAQEKPPQDADVIIVLGCGLRGEDVSLTLKNRLDTAIEYLENNEDTLVIVSGGKGGNETISEAEAMRRYLLKQDVDEARIIMEDQSTSTYENFAFSKALIKTLTEERFGESANIVFVTTNFHVLRAGLVAKSVGLDAQGIGASGISYLTPNDYIRESFALLAYLVTGKI